MRKEERVTRNDEGGRKEERGRRNEEEGGGRLNEEGRMNEEERRNEDEGVMLCKSIMYQSFLSRGSLVCLDVKRSEIKCRTDVGKLQSQYLYKYA